MEILVGLILLVMLIQWHQREIHDGVYGKIYVTIKKRVIRTSINKLKSVLRNA